MRKKISRAVAVGVLLFIVFGIIMLTNKVEYSLCLSVLSRSANITNFATMYVTVAAYIVAFIFALIIGVFVMAALPIRSNICIHFGEDTMPMYLSHLIVFMVCALIVDKENWIIASAISFLAMIGCLVVFSTDRYKKGFNRVFSIIKRSILKK